MKNLQIAGLDVPLKVSRQRQKNITLSIHPKSGVVHVRAPRWVRKSEIELFLAEQHDWMARSLNSLPPAIAFADGVQIPFLGQTRTIRHIPSRTRGVSDDGESLLVGGDAATLPVRLRKWLIERARREVTMRANFYAQQVGRTLNSIVVRDMHARWGSCSKSSRGGATIAFNWRLVMAPLHVLDYVVAHECAHLQHMNHGVQFWLLCAKLMGDYEPAELWLETHGASLMRIGA